MQRRRAIDLRTGDVGLTLKQRPHGVPVSLHGRIRDFAGGRGDFSGRKQDDQTTPEYGSHKHVPP